MVKVSIIGATGSLGRLVSKVLSEEESIDLTLFSRSVDYVTEIKRAKKIAASVSDKLALQEAVKGADLVLVALSGDLPSMISEVISAMKDMKTKRVIFIASYGIYGELPGQNGRVESILQPYRKAADILESSDLEYTILRPGWFDNSSTHSYHLIPKGEIVYGNNISRLAIVDFVKEVALDTSKYLRENFAIVRD